MTSPYNPFRTPLTDEITALKQHKDAFILAHYYTRPEIQSVADFVGDSLALSQQAADTSADMIVFAGVCFMAETAKILSPSKKVVIPDPEAGCSLADSCQESAFKQFLTHYPDHLVVSYVNTSVGVKSQTDICCTSSNAVELIKSIPMSQKIVFAPDRNLGNYLKSVTGRDDMVVWDGACHVHEAFSLEKILALRKKYPCAKVLAHPECKKPVLLVADYIGSTAALLKFAGTDPADTYIVVTEPGILFQMQRENPRKIFIPAPPVDSTCGCNDCEYMKLVTLEKVCCALRDENPEILIEESVRKKAERSILNMLNWSRDHHLILKKYL